MDEGGLRDALDEIFDQALIHHGFTDYMRDYELIVYVQADRRTGIAPAYLRYLFKLCVDAQVSSAVPPETWRVSLDERLTNELRQGSAELDGFVWGVRWQSLYPGGTIMSDSPAAREWSTAVGMDFHEIRLETNAQVISLVFAGLEVTEVPLGYSPFTVRDDHS